MKMRTTNIKTKHYTKFNACLPRPKLETIFLFPHVKKKTKTKKVTSIAIVHGQAE